MELSLEQQFEKKKWVDALESMHRDQIFELLMKASRMLMIKFVVRECLSKGEDLNFKLSPEQLFQLELIRRNHAETERETLKVLMINTLEDILVADSHIRELMVNGVPI